MSPTRTLLAIAIFALAMNLIQRNGTANENQQRVPESLSLESKSGRSSIVLDCRNDEPSFLLRGPAGSIGMGISPNESVVFLAPPDGDVSLSLLCQEARQGILLERQDDSAIHLAVEQDKATVSAQAGNLSAHMYCNDEDAYFMAREGPIVEENADPLSSAWMGVSKNRNPAIILTDVPEQFFFKMPPEDAERPR